MDPLWITKTVISRQIDSARSSRLLCSKLPMRAHRMEAPTGPFYRENGPVESFMDGPSWAASNTAIESFWRCLFVEIWPLLWSITVPIGVPGGPRGSQERPRRVSGTSPGVSGACPVVPGASPGVPGACPGVPWASWGHRGVPKGSPGSRNTIP